MGESVTIQRDLRLLEDGTWDALQARRPDASVFSSAPWLRAAYRAFGGDRDVLVLSAERDGKTGLAAFEADGPSLRLLGRGPSDYLDMAYGFPHDESAEARLAGAIMARAFEERPMIQLPGLVAERGTPARLRRSPLWHTTQLRATPAPAMRMSTVDRALRKKSVRRHVAGLGRVGRVEVDVTTDPREIAARLPALYDLHVARWAGTGTPSQFLRAPERRFFEDVAQGLGQTGAVRLARVCVSGRPVALHFGFAFRGVYTWYKPAFDPALAEHSPGEVLLDALLRDARSIGCHEFDFTVGDEPFKMRFATTIRTVVDLHVTASAWRAARTRGALAVRDTAKRVLAPVGLWDVLRARLGR